MRRYLVSYSIKHCAAGRTTEDLKKKNLRGADAVVVISLFFPKDGSRGQDTTSLNGRTGKPLDAIELWKTWACLTNQLCHVEGLHDWQKRMCVQVNEVITDIVTGKFAGEAHDQNTAN